MSTMPTLAKRVRLGEELPVFCEQCGYSLHGATQVRCESCSILQFQCPECGHHQPINTLRPAFARLLGRMQAAMLVIGVLFRLNFFGWLLFAWGAMGMEWSYEYVYISQPNRTGFVTSTSVSRPRSIDSDVLLAHGVFGLAFGLVGRMLLLRWRKSGIVGVILAALVIAATATGAWLNRHFGSSPFTVDYWIILLLAGGCVWFGALIAWPIWRGIVKLFVPRQWADPLLDWMQWKQEKLSGLGR
jgi:hypothetical protein